ncbi:MAG TPA: MerR family transcriptional regulator [Solibacterales bacterium]|nr:MerR family transcriptional regulator [Bryobacterales bacterium]
MAHGAAQNPNAPEIPDKLYFRIGEVARLVGVKPYVLRYWESEFSALSPKKSGANHRLYRRKDVELLLEIKLLLYEKRFTIEGARNYLDNRGRNRPAKPPARARQSQGELFNVPQSALEDIRKELRQILDLLA